MTPFEFEDCHRKRFLKKIPTFTIELMGVGYISWGLEEKEKRKKKTKEENIEGKRIEFNWWD